MKRPASLLAVMLLAAPLAACGIDNTSASVCGTTICVNSPTILCEVDTKIVYASFEVAVAPGRNEASYAIRGDTDLNSTKASPSYTVTAGKPIRHETSAADTVGPLKNALIEVAEGYELVRRLELDADDLCPF